LAIKSDWTQVTKHSTTVLPKNWRNAVGAKRPVIHASALLVEMATVDMPSVFARLNASAEGLTLQEVQARLRHYGQNVLAKDQHVRLATLLGHALRNPLVVLLAALATISAVSGDIRAATLMLVMVTLSVGLRLFQESKANTAASKLRAMISLTANVVRDGKLQETTVAQLVPGDVVQLAAGDMIPADVRIFQAKDLFVSQGALTGESFPVEKSAIERIVRADTPVALASIAFLGTSVESGSASAVVVATGKDTYLGGMAESIQEQRPETAFDKGVVRFTWLMLRLMLIMVPLVFVVNGWTKGNWTQAFFFALAVAVGLTPEMLPMIVTVCLSKGAVAMGRKKVIVKRIEAIQNLGAMDVLCADKTGTLTMDHVTLERHCNVILREDEGVLALAYLNSHFQTGLKNVLDRAILAHAETHTNSNINAYEKIDEIPFDFQRRIMSVVVRTPDAKDRIISKGAPEAIFPKCVQFDLDGVLLPMDHQHIEDLKKEYERLSTDGFRVLAIASKDVTPRGVVAGDATPYSKADEFELILRGYVAFLDPPKESAQAAIKAMQAHGISVKVVTGDNDLVARKICTEVGLSTEFVLLGDVIEKMSEELLIQAVEKTTLFARVTPAHKQRIIEALQARGRTVGFMGDGINDAPALHSADVGISVDTAVDIAKESADIILLQKSLLVLDEGMMEGRKVFTNIVKYVRMGGSSSFGNMFSVLGASIFVPFLPMLPLQILTNNLLYDISQTAIPTDTVDPESIAMPRQWDLKELTRFVVFIGPCSSVFDYTTYLVMLYFFNCWDTSTAQAAAHSASLFQTGWFVESLLTQTLIIHVIRTHKIPFLQSRSSWPVLLTGVLVMVIGVSLPVSPLAAYLGFTALPTSYWPILALTVIAYGLVTQGVKASLLRRKWI
jgi:P-type Mg2+ transporter